MTKLGWIFLTGVIAVGLTACGDTTSNPGEVDSGAIAVEETACIDIDRSVELAMQASDHLVAGGAAAEAFDIEGAAAEMRLAAGLYDEISTLWIDVDPEIANYAQLASDRMNDGADRLGALEIDAATQYIEMATGYIDDMTAAVELLDPTTLTQC